ncbi:hypothetical protein JYU09_00875 [bacterium AH-315-O15]|nr:hypothetical protein [bacterium AH-315-O15]
MRNQFLLGVVACAAEPGPAATVAETEPATLAPELPELVVAERGGGFIPEGVEYDTKNGRLLTGSLSEGTIFEVHADGRLTPAVSDPDLVSSVGIEVDEPRDRLLVANADSSVFQGGSAAGDAGCVQPDDRRADRDGRSCGGDNRSAGRRGLFRQ